MKRLLVILMICLLGAGSLPAQNASAQKDRKAKLEREIEILNKQLKDNAKKSSSALTKLTLARKKVSARKELVAESDKVIAGFDARIKEKQKEIDKAQALLDTMTYYYGRLVHNAYKNRDPRIWYMYLLSGDSVNQTVRRYTYLRNLSSKMNLRAEKIMEAKAALEKEKGELLALRAEAGKERDKRAAELKKLQADEKESAQIVSQLKKDKTKYQKQLASKRKQVEALNKEIERLIAGSMGGGKSTSNSKKGAKTGAKTSTTVDTKLSGEFAANKGKLPWPVEGSVVESFGQHYHPVYKSVKLPFNNGVNIAVAKGASVSAVFDGTVKQIIVMPGYNKCILVQHGEYFTFYCKLKDTSVKAGDKVKTGQKLGTVDTINDETQLHFQLWKGRSPQNPENWLK